VEQNACLLFQMQLNDTQGKRLYLTADERRAFMVAASKAPRPVRTFCAVLHDSGCRISEALTLTPERIDLIGQAVVFETLKKRRSGVYRAVPGRRASSPISLTSCTASGRSRGAVRAMPTAPCGRGRATPPGGTSRQSWRRRRS
jgi:integrase